ncbi:hypothetical protein HW555_007139 [Spodoptera exigua]|uniref:Uncharacterized protein n=1 Tax=Spodoptera exigua TaxID=7107 RepID=A0A835GFM5_SPOEX|nr:hypothetical protein HW555_007139 [Spodoptera exigua]
MGLVANIKATRRSKRPLCLRESEIRFKYTLALILINYLSSKSDKYQKHHQTQYKSIDRETTKLKWAVPDQATSNLHRLTSRPKRPHTAALIQLSGLEYYVIGYCLKPGDKKSILSQKDYLINYDVLTSRLHLNQWCTLRELSVRSEKEVSSTKRAAVNVYGVHKVCESRDVSRPTSLRSALSQRVTQQNLVKLLNLKMSSSDSDKEVFDIICNSSKTDSEENNNRRDKIL